MLLISIYCLLLYYNNVIIYYLLLHFNIIDVMLLAQLLVQLLLPHDSRQFEAYRNFKCKGLRIQT